LKAILACDLNGGIGFNGRLPWGSIPGDLPRFKSLTHQKAVIMGRGTYESTDMPVPLPNRKNYVVSSTLDSVKDGVTLLNSVEQAATIPDAWVIGGSLLFNSLLAHIDTIELTYVKATHTCDTWINLDQIRSEFELVHNQEWDTHSFQTWKRKCNNTLIV